MRALIILISFTFFAPRLAFAQSDFAGLMGDIQSLIAGAVPIIISLGVILFFWGLVKYVRSAENPAAREEGRQLIVYGIIAIFVMVSMWGLVNVLVETVIGNDDVLLDDGDIPQGPFIE